MAKQNNVKLKSFDSDVILTRYVVSAALHVIFQVFCCVFMQTELIMLLSFFNNSFRTSVPI